MAYSTNVNLIRNGYIKNWEIKDFPQLKIIYQHQNVLYIKMYFWLRFFFKFNRIVLIQLNIYGFEDNNKLLDIVINRSFFKKRYVKNYWLLKKFKIHHNAINLLYGCYNKLLLNRRLFFNKKNIYRIYNKYKYRKKNINIFNLSNKLGGILNIKSFLYFLIIKQYYNNIKNFYNISLIKKFFNNKFLYEIKLNNQLDIKPEHKSRKVNKHLFKSVKFINTTSRKKSIFKKKIYNDNEKNSNYLYNNINVTTRIRYQIQESIFNLFKINFLIRFRFEKLKYKSKLEKELIIQQQIQINKSRIKLDNKIYYYNLPLPKLIMETITEYNEHLINMNIFQFMKSSQFKLFETRLITALKFNNLQMLADLLAVTLIRKWHHQKFFQWLSALIDLLQLNTIAGKLLTYRIGLYGRVDNSTRSKTVFFANKTINKPKRSSFSSKIQYAEAYNNARIGAFHVRLWFEYLQ